MNSSTNWKYKVVEIKPKLFTKGRETYFEDQINKFGARGWELISVKQYTVQSQTMLFFKKPV